MISATNLKKDYDDGLVQALRGVSFEIEKGEMISIMGPSGCGKSTLLNLIGTLDLPTGGEDLELTGNLSRTIDPLIRSGRRPSGSFFNFTI